MRYSEIVEVYERLAGTTKKLEKTRVLAEFLPKIKGNEEWAYLLRGRVFADYDVREFGFSTQLVIKAIARASGVDSSKVNDLFKKKGDLGEVAAEIVVSKKQVMLFHHRLDVEHVLLSLRKLAETEGSGAVDRKLGICAELLGTASKEEAKYLIRTLLGDLRIGVADALLIDAISLAFGVDNEKVKNAYDLLTDFAQVLKLAIKGQSALNKVDLVPGRPVNVMLAVKVSSIEEGFEVCGKPAALEHKYDGFRVVISFDGRETRLFTRRLEEVTKQFPDVVKYAREHIKASSYIVDCEVVGFKDKKYLPFEAVSQRIKRKYDIKELSEKLPVEVNVFDLLFLNGENTVNLSFKERRKLLEKIVKPKDWELKLAKQIITSDFDEAGEFYQEALRIGEEGIMMKNLESKYKAGRAVGYMVKLKPETKDLDVVIVGGEYGTGKRAGGLTSFIIACKDNGNFLEIGKVSSGLKEKSEEGTSYKEIDALLKPLVIEENDSGVKVRPKIVVSVTYQNIQPSPRYSSGYALRFPRITHYRPERGINDIASLWDIKDEFKKGSRAER